VAVCIYQLQPSIPDKNKHVVSDKTYNCPHNSKSVFTPPVKYIIKGILRQRIVLIACFLLLLIWKVCFEELVVREYGKE